MRRAASLVALATLLLSVGAPAQAAAPGLLGATYTLDVPISAASMRAVYPDTTQDVPGTGTPVTSSYCGRDHFTVNETANWFRFHEEQTENGCGEARFLVALPTGTRAVTIEFEADRSIRQTSQVDLPKSMPQQLRIYDQNTSSVAAFDYYDSSAAPHDSRQHFVFPVPLQPGQANMTVAWFFSDLGGTVGQAAVNPLFGQSLASTVTHATASLQGITASLGGVTQERTGIQGGAVRYETTVPVSVPEELLTRGALSLHLGVTSDLAFSHVVGPQGSVLPADLLVTSESAGAREVVLTQNATALYGHGTYLVVFTSSTPVYSSTALYAFAIGIIAVPAVAGLLAARQTRAFRRQATRPFAGTATNLDRVVVGMLAAYLLLPVAVIAGNRLPIMTALPLNNEAALIYLLIVTALAAFVVVGFVGRRHLSAIMSAEAAAEEKARHELERSNRELAEFAYVASHDLQEPLRTVASYAQLLKRRYQGKLDADADTFIDNTVAGAERMQGLIQDLLAYSRVGAQPGPLEDVSIAKVVDIVRSDLGSALREANAQVTTAGLPTVRGHERELHQVFQNLIGNALKFRSPRRQLRVSVTATRDPGAWRFAVRDNGIGIESQHHALIFQIFQQLHTRGEFAGNGIGLSICKRIVELKGGKIGVDSEPGKGSTFWFTWPDPAVGKQ